MRQKTILVVLYVFLGLFVFNQVADLVSNHKKDASTYCEMNEVEELSELSSRFKAFEPTDLFLIEFHFGFIRDLFLNIESVSPRSLQRAFFPHALHVPIYLDKGVLLV